MRNKKGIFDFQSLSVLKQIIENEKRFRIQIISLEPIDLFLEFLDSASVEYRLQNISKPSNSSINIQIEKEDVKASRIILYNNRRESDYIQIVFKLTMEEKKRYLESQVPDRKKLSLLLDTYPYKNTDELKKLAVDYTFNISEIMKSSFDYLESVILLCMIRNTKLMDIISNIKQVDPNLHNVFMIRNKLTSLTERKVVVCNRDNYKINISFESLKKILARIDFDLNKT